MFAVYKRIVWGTDLRNWIKGIRCPAPHPSPAVAHGVWSVGGRGGGIIGRGQGLVEPATNLCMLSWKEHACKVLWVDF